MSSEHGRWQGFLDSLATKGGNIFLLVLANVAFGALVIHLYTHGQATGALVAAMGQTFGNFSGALLMALSGKERTPNGNGKPPSEAPDKPESPVPQS